MTRKQHEEAKGFSLVYCYRRGYHSVQSAVDRVPSLLRSLWQRKRFGCGFSPDNQHRGDGLRVHGPQRRICHLGCVEAARWQNLLSLHGTKPKNTTFRRTNLRVASSNAENCSGNGWYKDARRPALPTASAVQFCQEPVRFSDEGGK